MSITEQGRAGEAKARLFFKHIGLGSIHLFQADWLIKLHDIWYIIEVKEKDKFEPPPFWGHGLDMRQVKARLEFYQDTGIRCLLLVFDPEGEVYWQWLDLLENGEKFTTRNGIRIYPLTQFHELDFQRRLDEVNFETVLSPEHRQMFLDSLSKDEGRMATLF